MQYRKPWVKALNSFLKIMNLKNTTTMKKFYTIMLAVLLGGIAAQAQDDSYQPLVREGVRWVNVHEAFHDDYSCYFYNFEFRGDTIINGKTYKKCYKYTGKALDLSKDTAYCAMRDEGHKVYEVPFNGLNENFETAWWSYSENETIWNELNTTGEFTLFDFDNPFDPWDWDETPSRMSPKMAAVMANSSFKENFIPGIGFDNEVFGDAFHPFVDICTCINYDTYGFHHLEDLDGNILYQGAAFDREENIYSPIVREGVVWEYLYVNEDNTMSVERFQIVGDTTLTDISGYKLPKYKCYRYFEEHLDTTKVKTVAYLDEESRIVSVSTTPIATHDKENFLEEFGWTYSLPTINSRGYESFGERDVYNFNWMVTYMNNLNEFYNCDYFSLSDTAVKYVRVGDQMNRYASITGIGMVDGKWIEGVGIDGYHTGNLITPLAPSSETGTQGLIRLADLDGNTLYEGAYYNTYYGNKYDVNHDGMVDIADINILINVMLGYDVPVGHQGHDTIPAETAEKIMDVTGDGHVDITDINTLINKMLGK